MERLWKVYKHTTPNDKVYIGITSQTEQRRWQGGYGYATQQKFYRAIKKYGWDNIKHEILYEDLTLEEAEEKERELILQYKSSDSKFGYNVANGGSGKGTCSEETKRKISIANKGKHHSLETIEKFKARRGEKNSRFGVKLSEETKQKMREKALGRVISEKQRKHLSELYKGRTGILCHSSKKVGQYTKDGELINTYFGVAEASRQTNIDKTTICEVCNGKPHKKTAGGYIWKYL